MEQDLSTCRKCLVIKVRISSGTFDGRNKKFVDEHGKLWNGRTCGECNSLRVKEAMQKSRLLKKLGQ